jgi:hypothetical protein
MAVKTARAMLAEAHLGSDNRSTGPSGCTMSKDAGCSPSGSQVHFQSPTTLLLGPDAAHKLTCHEQRPGCCV